MGSSVGIGALIMGVTLLSIFAIATTVLSNQAEVALQVTDPDVIEKPELTLSNLVNSGSVAPGGLNLDSAGGNYYPGDLDFTGSCDVFPTGTFTVSSESWQLGPFEDESGGNYDGEYFSFQELDDELGATSDWYVWYNVDASSIDPNPGGTGIQVDILSLDGATEIRDDTISALALQNPPLTEVTFSSGVDTLIATYLQSGPAVSLAISNPLAPFPILASNDGGQIDSIILLDGGSGCTSAPSTTPNVGPFPGAGGQVTVNTMQWDYSFDITNDGDKSIKLSDIFSTINGGTTEVLSSTPVFTVEYIFPGEKINIVKDADSADSLSRVAISSHGMNVAVEL